LWRALDGRVLHKAAVSASERYDTRLEAHLVTALGVRFVDRRGPTAGRRTVREIVGMDEGLLAAWSSRRRDIDIRRGVLAGAFQRDHGRPPTAVEAIALAQQATLETRGPKHEPRSLGEQRMAWRQEALTVLGGSSALSRMLGRALGVRSPPCPELTDGWIYSAADRVLDNLATARATWQVWHVRAEAERVVRATALRPGDVDAAVTRVTQRVLSPALSLPLGEPDPVAEPPELRRADGASVYTVAGSRLHTSRAVLDAEALLLAAAARRDGRRIDPAHVAAALLTSSAEGVTLNDGQAQLVRELAGSGARLQLALAPAGTGKTTALAALARAWAAAGGSVLGLAPSAVATAGLRSVLGGTCDTLTKLTWSLDSRSVPEWVTAIGPGTLVVIDEAGMAGTRELARAVEHVVGRGGSVRLVGDHQQLASVAAGGLLAEIAAAHGAVTLTEPVRFTDPAEAAATVAIRDGDTTGLGFYLDHGRIHVGDLATCAAQAYTAWAAERSRGRDALLLAATREVVTELNARARDDRLAAATSPPGPEVQLADGTRASAGDRIITRANDRRLPITATDWVKNGDRFTVRAVHGDGALDVVHSGTGRRTLLPAAYVREHVDLGYASTVHGAQGVTADTCHTVLTGTESRQQLYVALTRGRNANSLHVATVGDGDPHSIITPAAVHPPTATDLLTAVLARDGAQTAAVSAHRVLTDPADQLQEAAARYGDAVHVAAEIHLGAMAMAQLEDDTERVHPGVTAAPAWPTLRGHLALLACSGADPAVVLTAAVEARELDTADDPAAVLVARLPHSEAGGPLPWLPAIPPTLADDPHWGPYLRGRAALVAARATRVTERAAAMTAADAASWARPLLAPRHVPLRTDLAVWRAAMGVPDGDRRPTGALRSTAAERRHQRQLLGAVEAAADAPAGSAVWAALADALDPRLRLDDHWPALAERLAAADRAGLDMAGLTAAVALARPLPDDLPAAALWWRLSPHLTPDTAPSGGIPAPRPAWYGTLVDRLTNEEGRSPTAAPTWPALIAAIAAGARAGWAPGGLLTAALTGLPGDAPTAVDGLIEQLVFRISGLAGPVPGEAPEPLPEDLQPPEDAHLLPSGDPLPHLLDVTVPLGEAADEEQLAASDDSFSSGPPQPDPPSRDRVRPHEPDAADYLLEEHFWATAAVPRDRLVELNAHAAAFFAAHTAGSWVPDYLRDRLSAGVPEELETGAGHAPAGWRTLVDHLRGCGATEGELLAAGLAVRARTGGLIDRFRDRLTFPIRDATGVVRGFIARRNPVADGADHAGPKYLNTPTTDLYRKGDHLLGLYESLRALRAGAVPAVVEGPLDALALTMAGRGRTVGLATLGTALTDRQADLIGPYLTGDDRDVLVATDGDAAGRRAAERMFWQLTGRGGAPRTLALPNGLDPADVLRRDGTRALSTAIEVAGSLADRLLDDQMARVVLDGTDGKSAARVRGLSTVIAALPPLQRLDAIERATASLGLQAGMLHQAVLLAEPPVSTASTSLPQLPHDAVTGGAAPAGSWRLPRPTENPATDRGRPRQPPDTPAR
jgi:DNA primase catalytic core